MYDDVGCAVKAVNVTVTGQKNRLFIIYFIAEFENDAEFFFFCSAFHLSQSLVEILLACEISLILGLVQRWIEKYILCNTVLFIENTTKIVQIIAGIYYYYESQS